MCRTLGANAGCEHCPRQYHVACGLNRGVLFMMNKSTSYSFCWECVLDQSLIQLAEPKLQPVTVTATDLSEDSDDAAEGAVDNTAAPPLIQVNAPPLDVEAFVGEFLEGIFDRLVETVAVDPLYPINQVVGVEPKLDGFIARVDEPAAVEPFPPINEDDHVEPKQEAFVARMDEPAAVECFDPIDYVEPKQDDISFGSSIIEDDGQQIYFRVVTLMPDVVTISSDEEI